MHQGHHGPSSRQCHRLRDRFRVVQALKALSCVLNLLVGLTDRLFFSFFWLAVYGEVGEGVASAISGVVMSSFYSSLVGIVMAKGVLSLSM